MEKTKLGVTVGALGAFTYFAGYFSGYFVAVILAGYILLMEENIWLKRCSVKSVTLLAAFSLLNALLNLIPDVIGFIGSLANVFNGYFEIVKLRELVSMLTSAVYIVQKVLFLCLGLRALNQRTINLSIIDVLVSRFLVNHE